MHKSNAYSEPTFDEDPILEAADENSTTIRIRGLRSLGGDIFRLEGVKPREIDWQGLFRAIGEPDDGTVNERLADAISTAIRKHDLIALLTDRVAMD